MSQCGIVLCPGVECLTVNCERNYAGHCETRFEQFWQILLIISVMAQSLTSSFRNGTNFDFELHAKQVLIGVMHAEGFLADTCLRLLFYAKLLL